MPSGWSACWARSPRRIGQSAGAPQLLSGTGEDKVHLVVVVTADRGLCGGFNGQVVRGARNLVNRLLADGKEVKILCVGRKGRDGLKRDFQRLIIETVEGLDPPRDRASMRPPGSATGSSRCSRTARSTSAPCSTTGSSRRSPRNSPPSSWSRFRRRRPPRPRRARAPVRPRPSTSSSPTRRRSCATCCRATSRVQLYRALLESYAGEQGARMAAMDNATRNAGEMIGRLTLNYNRTRQASITREMIEIVSGAEAV